MSDRLFLRLLLRLKGRSDAGVTLLELLIVVGILAILAAIALPPSLRALAEARRQEAVSRISNIADSQQRYFSGLNGGSFASSFQELQNLSVDERSALAESPSYSYSMSLTGAGTAQYVIIQASPKRESYPVAAGRVFLQDQTPYFVVCSGDPGTALDVSSVVIPSDCPE